MSIKSTVFLEKEIKQLKQIRKILRNAVQNRKNNVYFLELELFKFE